ncbi:hypothetical protein CVT24_001141 [Panaeolus cyanescens]|uniref:lytic cellulose monooxygenase (C4-dehydrogenating) n=1 Tax=Panaeolus cyanescens TaxID=181874 RepID=A0A409WS66_9AGAR|nr:hypothetical protein CVT24_001141 [Panaeolus cyanescens]
MKSSFSLLSLLSAVASVSAHGFLAGFQVNNGDVLKAPSPNNADSPNNSPIRSVSSPDPNYLTSNPAITCGPNSKAGTTVANVNPGDTMSFDWEGADGSNWPHNTGPMITYMASCGDQDCNSISNPADLKWFKIDQVGRKPNSADWAQADLMKGGVATVSVPSDLAPGNYMVRHEIIALHLATTIDMAEFYPGCVALKVGGSQTGTPKSSDLVSFPGAYKDSDPGIFDPDVFNSRVQYIFPGPEVAALSGSGGTGSNSGSSAGSGTNGGSGSGSSGNANGGSSNGGTSNNGGSSGSGSGSSSGTTPAPSGSSKSCSIKKRTLLAGSNKEVLIRPRHFSRVMRRLVSDLTKAKHVY